MAKFKKGDRVRCIRSSVGNLGATGVITSTDNSDLPYEVDLSESGKGPHWWAAEAHLELIESAGLSRRLDKARAKVARLEEQLAAETKPVYVRYDWRKNYVFVQESGIPYLMVKCGGNFRFHSFEHAAHGWSTPKSSGQECLDYHAKSGTIHEFADSKDAIAFFHTAFTAYHGGK